MKLPKVRKLPSGMYFCQLRIGGKSIPITEKSEKLALAKAAAIKGGLLKPRSCKDDMTVGEAVDRYIDMQSNILSPATLVGYLQIRKNNLGSIENKPLNKVSQTDMQRFVNTLSKEYSPKTVRNIWGLVNSALTRQMPDVYYRINLPQKNKPQTRIPTEEDMFVLLNAVRDTEMEIPILLAAFGSLRRSEICALTDKDIVPGGIYVNKALVMDKDKNWVVKKPKTVESERIAELPEFVMNKLSAVNGKITHLNPVMITKRFRRCLKKLGITTFRFHDLRHYWVSIAKALNMPDEYIMRNGGWTTIDTPRKVYLHIVEEENRKKTNALKNYFENRFNA